MYLLGRKREELWKGYALCPGEEKGKRLLGVGQRASGGFYSLVEIVEIIEGDEGKVEPSQGEKAHTEDEEEPGTITLPRQRRGLK